MKQVNIQSTIELKEIIKTKYEKKDFKYFDPNPIYEYMNEKYGPQILRKTHGKELLMLLFAPKSISDDGLTYVLEFDNSLREFGGIGGGTAHKFTLYFSEKKGWVFGNHPKNAKIISENEAIVKAEEIRDNLLAAVEVIKKYDSLNSIEDYKKLDKELKEKLDFLYFRSWVQKYFAFIFPNVFTNFYGKMENMKWCEDAFRLMGIEASKNITVRHGQFVLFFKDLNIPNFFVYRIVLELFVEECSIKRINWLISCDPKEFNIEGWFNENEIIDWHRTRPMKNISIGDVVFIYVSNPKSSVRYKCIVINNEVPESESIDDSKFWLGQTRDSDDGLICVRLQLISKCYDEKLSLNMLLNNGLNGAPQGPMRLIDEKEQLYQYINSFFDDKGSVTNLNKWVYDDLKQRKSASNIVVYGTPGCGKSYYVDNTLIKKDQCEKVIRTTFYQDYTNTDFVGQILPYVKPSGDIIYKFNPGPFALALKEALLLGERHNVALVIEELNRGNAPAIFGDIFQLLDREDNGISRYSITNINLLDWLNNELELDLSSIKLPNNLFIYATMNTSDQNVFTLDTAFKRRWDFLKIKNTFDDYTDAFGNNHSHEYKSYKVPLMNGITWQQFVEEINKAIIGKDGERNGNINVSDKQLGIYFVGKNFLHEGTVSLEEINNPNKAEKFAYKVLSYLWDDVCKFDKDKLFDKDIITLDDLVDKYVARQIIFEENLQNTFNSLATQKDSESNETE